VRKTGRNILVIGVGIAVLVLLTAYFSYKGFSEFPTVFGPNFKSALVGGCMGAAMSLAVVLIGFILQRDNRLRALEPARFLFLRQEAQELKESYIIFINTLRIGGPQLVTLTGKTWLSLDKTSWPDRETINAVEEIISQSPISGDYNGKAIWEKYERLRKATDAVVHASAATSVFEGNEKLIEGVLWQADYDVRSLLSKLILLIRPRTNMADEPVNLSSATDSIKSALVSTGTLLTNLCELGKDIRVK
jgi:hypothetical protein